MCRLLRPGPPTESAAGTKLSEWWPGNLRAPGLHTHALEYLPETIDSVVGGTVHRPVLRNVRPATNINGSAAMGVFR